MWGWLFASMSGLTRIATRATTSGLARQRLHALELAGRLDVDRLEAERHRARELGVRLADAGEDDVVRREAGLRASSISQIELASAPAAQVAEEPRERERGVGLERVVDRVRIVAEAPRRGRGSAGAGARRCRRRPACLRRRRWPTARRRRRRALERLCGEADHSGVSGYTNPLSAACLPISRPDSRRYRRADPALPGGRSARVGGDRPPVPAQGVQRRVQVRRQARRGRGPDAGHLPEDLQVARHLRSAREFPDLADQRQPQPLHRPLPQRAEGARDDRSRRGRRGAAPPRRPARARSRRSSSAIASSCCARRSRRCRRRCGPPC